MTLFFSFNKMMDPDSNIIWCNHVPITVTMRKSITCKAVLCNSFLMHIFSGTEYEATMIIPPVKRVIYLTVCRLNKFKKFKRIYCHRLNWILLFLINKDGLRFTSTKWHLWQWLCLCLQRKCISVRINCVKSINLTLTVEKTLRGWCINRIRYMW